MLSAGGSASKRSTVAVVVPSSNVTLAEVARHAGVGLATASRALRDAPGVAPATRERVRAVAEQLSFVPSPEASQPGQGERRAGSRIVVPHLDRWFFGAIVAGLESVLRDADVDVLLYHVGDLDDRRHVLRRACRRDARSTPSWSWRSRSTTVNVSGST